MSPCQPARHGLNSHLGMLDRALAGEPLAAQKNAAIYLALVCLADPFDLGHKEIEIRLRAELRDTRYLLEEARP